MTCPNYFKRVSYPPGIGDTRACPDCGRPQHYTGTEHGWAHDATVDTWNCADPAKTLDAYQQASNEIYYETDGK